MKITKVETIWFEALPQVEWAKLNATARQALPNNLWVRIHTDTGLSGLGESYYLPRAVAAVIHDVYAPLLLGRDPRDIENHWNNLFALVNFCGAMGAEMRAISAVDVALWDLFGQIAGQPIYMMLGGRSRDRLPIYNTCVGYGKYPDLDAWMSGKAGELAADLLRQGIRAMKIWPFDQFGPTLAGPGRERQQVTVWGAVTAAGTLGHAISNEDLARGVAIVADIRKAVGDRMRIAIEGHARWDLPSATRIARAIAPYDILWLEEIMPPDNVDAYVRLKADTEIPICQSERVFTRFGFRPVDREERRRHHHARSILGRRADRRPQDRGDGRHRLSADHLSRHHRPRGLVGGEPSDDARAERTDHGDSSRLRRRLVQ